MSGPIPLGGGAIAGAAALLVVNAALSIWLRLGLEGRLAVAAIRSVVQLLLLGYLLVPVFEWAHPGAIAAIAVVMLVMAARESVRRVSRRYPGIALSAFVTLFAAGAITTFLGTRLIIGVEPWWTPQYLVPMLGMILGNALTGVSLGLDRCLVALDEGRGRIESLLALGATRWEAARPVAREAIRTGMVPILNAMSVVGVVSIPGMMTGQILGGTPPEEAARYQIVILFLIAATVAMGVLGAVLLALRATFDDCHRLRAERVTRR